LTILVERSFAKKFSERNKAKSKNKLTVIQGLGFGGKGDLRKYLMRY